MRSTVVVLVLMTALRAGAGEVLLGAAGRTRHRIVVPNAYADARIGASVKQAAELLQRFFRKLHQQLDFLPEAAAFGHRIKNPLLPFSALYTGDLVNELDNQLSRAEAIPVSPAVKARLAATRFEFDYLRHIVNTVVHYHAYRLRPNEVSLDRLLSAVEARNAWIESFPKPRPSFGTGTGPTSLACCRKRTGGSRWQ